MSSNHSLKQLKGTIIPATSQKYVHFHNNDISYNSLSTNLMAQTMFQEGYNQHCDISAYVVLHLSVYKIVILVIVY